MQKRKTSAPTFVLPNINYGESNLLNIRKKYQVEMSAVADFDRSTDGMKTLYNDVCICCEKFFDKVRIQDDGELSEMYKLYDMLLTQRATLSAMIYSAKHLGTHGSALVDKTAPKITPGIRDTRTLTKLAGSEFEPISKMPDPELWFETLLARRTKESEE